MDKPITFMINGKKYTRSKKDVERALKERDVKPDKINTYYVIVNKKRYPVKQALAETLKIGRSTFITTDAHRQLEKMGFEVACTLYGD
ncbi:MAG: hypothetical protein ISS47_06060 [Candidatus Omnitrophica bacterium]|nr:hypothetical protein [Candidatus Omnitrophota bacterium]